MQLKNKENKMKKILFIIVFLLVGGNVDAKVILPSILSDNAVLQRNSEVVLWGKATPNKKVKITTSWNGEKYQTLSDSEGNWQQTVVTSDAGVGYSVSFNDGETTTIQNILLGEVWLCSGQSNMELSLTGNPTQPIEQATDLIFKANKDIPIRLFKVEQNPMSAPQESCSGEWKENTTEAVAKFSATAYFFAKYLNEVLGVPVGVVTTSWGGTKIESWISKEGLSKIKEYDLSGLANKDSDERYHMQPTTLHNGMIYPLRNLKFKGMIWYQGEANRSNGEEYLKLFPTFVGELRGLFDCGDFPVYYAQIAPFGYAKKNENVLMRETMAKLMSLVDKCGMVTLTDAGEETVIHPREKYKAGERFAYWALGDAYGIQGVDYRAPEYGDMQIMDADKRFPCRIAIRFDYAPRGVCFGDGMTAATTTNFEIAGEDRVFYPAQVKMMPKNEYLLEVWSDDVPNPVAVRYAFKNYVKGDLFNTFGVPVSSFRSDDWEF